MPDDLNIDEILASFVYSGNKLRLDIELVQWRILSEVDRLIDDMIFEKTRLMRNGASARRANAVIKGMIDNEDGVYKSWLNRQDKIIQELTNTLVQAPAMEVANQNPRLKHAWVLGVVKTSHCSDCKRLSSMEPRTIDEWRKIGLGLPREGQTICSYGCRCLLKPVKG